MMEMNESHVMEEWRDVFDWEEYYQVSNLGRVRRKDRYINVVHKHYGEHVKHINGGILSSIKTNDPYKHHILSAGGNRYSVRTHVLVARAFVLNPENKPQVNHIDGNKWNNNADNLEWCTRSENGQHAYDMGLHIAPHGERHFRAKLKEKDVFDIIDLYNNGMKMDHIALKYGIGHMTVLYVLRGDTWKHLKIKELGLSNYPNNNKHIK